MTTIRHRNLILSYCNKYSKDFQVPILNLFIKPNIQSLLSLILFSLISKKKIQIFTVSNNYFSFPNNDNKSKKILIKSKYNWKAP